MIKSFRYSLKEAVIQLFRHKAMAVASIFSITAMLIILSLFFFLTVNISFATESLKSQFNSIEVFLLDSTTENDAEVMIGSLVALNEVDHVDYISKDQALEDFKESWGDNGYLLDGLSTNPLPNSLRITLRDIKDGDFVASICESMIGVEDIRYYQNEVNKILNISDTLQKGALIVIVFLIFVSIVVVFNTVKLNVMSRQKEISIMKYVGATNWFVRGPLLTEGILIGSISAGISLGLTGMVYTKIQESFGEQLQMLFSTSFVEKAFMMENLAWIFLALGISIGSIGSILAVRRFLKV